MTKAYGTLDEYLDDLDEIKVALAEETRGMDAEQVQAFFAEARNELERRTGRKVRVRRVGRKAALPSMFFPAAPSAPTPKRWTCAEFHLLGDSGWFKGRRAMLIDGEILEMAGSNPPHATATTLADYELKKVFPVGFVVRIQMPLVLGLMTDPEPDLAVVTGNARDYLSAHPTTALLVMEISDSSLAFDTTDKASIFAAGNIPDYWVVDLVNRQVIVFRNPQPDSTQPFGHGYASKTTYTPGSPVSPLAAPQAAIAVADLLP